MKTYHRRPCDIRTSSAKIGKVLHLSKDIKPFQTLITIVWKISAIELDHVQTLKYTYEARASLTLTAFLSVFVLLRIHLRNKTNFMDVLHGTLLYSTYRLCRKIRIQDNREKLVSL